ncbi:MAG TPA: hypothetical protein VLG12_01565 [Candidatus Saccharimonadales bacterium]|nr:hypothetical protein [Candidatus Saccharimonadales bacterium]
MKIDEINTKIELIETARGLIEGKVNLLDGCITIDSMIDVANDDHDFLLPIKGILSDAEDLVGQSFKNPVYPESIRENLNKYIAKEKALILEISEEIIKKYSNEIKRFESSIIKILLKQDPIALYFKDLKGKYFYEIELKAILEKLAECQSKEQVQNMIIHFFIDMYGEVSKKDKKIFENIGNEIWSLIN